MGHDISGYVKGKEVAFLHRSAFSEFRSVIYEALRCNQFYNNCSGNGGEREFTKEELLLTLQILGDNDNFEPERTFLKNCLDSIENKILIIFG